MKKITILSFLLLFTTFISCSSDEPAKETLITPVIVTPSAITITSASSEFLYSGETLEILGANFVNKDYPTKIFLNDIEVTPKSLTNTTLQVVIPENIRTGNNVLKIKIDKVVSPDVSFYTLAKGWNQLNLFATNDIINSAIFDENKFIVSFVDFGSISTIAKITPERNGYKAQGMGLSGGSYGAFKMLNEKNGVITQTGRAVYTDDTFTTNKSLQVSTKFSPEINGLRIFGIDNTSSILYTIIGSQIYTSNNGQTVIMNNHPAWSETPFVYRIVIKGFGKSISNNKFYQLGFLVDKKGSTELSYKNIVMESATGYSDWIVKDTISRSIVNNEKELKFLDINKIYCVDLINKTLLESADQLKSWNIIKNNVHAFFMRSTTKWYVQSDNKIFVTSDAGQTWSLELELPAGAVVNDISFSDKKIIVSGKKGLLYLKIE